MLAGAWSRWREGIQDKFWPRLGRQRHPDQGGGVLVNPAQLVCLGFADVHNQPVSGVGDLAGWLPVEVTPEMVGHTIAVYLNPECKPPKGGRVSEEQRKHIGLVKRDGGIAGVVKCAADVREMIADWFSRFAHKPPE